MAKTCAESWPTAALLIATLLLPPVLSYSTYDGYRLLETQKLDDGHARALAAAGATWDFWQEPRRGASAVVLASPEQTRIIEAALVDLGILYSEKQWTPPQTPVTRRMQRRWNGINIDFETFYRVDEIHAYVDGLAQRFPQLVSVSSLGRSTEGRDLKLLRISTSGDKIGLKPAIFIDATIHAREWIAPAVALYTINQLVENYEANSALLDGVDWYILPVINPDGYEYTFTNERFWRRTRSERANTTCIGVDANRNFDFHWDENTARECSDTFAGLNPFSEPETAALATFLSANNDHISLYLTLHSYGQLLLTPWGYTDDMPEDADELIALADEAAAALAAVRGTEYTVGSSANVLYYSYGTSRDWAKGVAGIKYSYTLELPSGGSGFDPPPEDILPVVTETFEAIKVFAKTVAARGLRRS